ncbi:MAG: hypothetical protein IKR86_00860 [Candidatus Methanomethylophilaceae archaeon]|nr:hypothetical protein [Candidatus Methanomethylophilaceae archaeon]
MKVLYLAAVAVVAVIVAMFVIHADVQKSEDGGYLYAVYTDSESNTDVVDVYESHVENGRATALLQRYRTSDSAGGINPLWEFDSKTGKGPFGSFYAAVNLLADGPAYHPDDSAEKRRSSVVGAVAYVLDPSDLSRTLAGHVFSPGLYNVMLVVPTVYWLSERTVAERSAGNLVGGVEYNVLYLSSSPSYTPSGHAKVSGMVPYAHSASLESGRADFVTHVYPYLGIGVYEGYATVQGDAAGPRKLVSQSGRVPTAGPDVDGFKALADSLVPMSGDGLRSCYQQWNYYQWTLYKMMCYAVMGSKNSQGMVGAGYTQGRFARCHRQHGLPGILRHSGFHQVRVRPDVLGGGEGLLQALHRERLGVPEPIHRRRLRHGGFVVVPISLCRELPRRRDADRRQDAASGPPDLGGHIRLRRGSPRDIRGVRGFGHMGHPHSRRCGPLRLHRSRPSRGHRQRGRERGLVDNRRRKMGQRPLRRSFVRMRRIRHSAGQPVQGRAPGLPDVRGRLPNATGRKRRPRRAWRGFRTSFRSRPRP